MKKYNEAILKDIKEIEAIFEEGLTIINPNTREYNNIWSMYNDGCNLRDCYGSYSYEKEKVYDKYESKCYDVLNGYSFGIQSFNSMQFTLTFRFKYNYREYKMYITKCYNKIICIDWEDEDEE